MTRALSPFRLEPVYLPKVWGAPALPKALQAIFGPPPKTGEIWLASDRHHVTPAAGGPLGGLGLDEITRRWPLELVGDAGARFFPLILKILSVGQWLSVQVHPDDENARRLEGEPWGKSEAWHVLAAEPGAEIIHGLARPLGAEALRGVVERGMLADVLARVPAGRGMTYAIPAGTIHATGPGLTILEVQQASDVTYRFYDWDRPGDDGNPRPLHLEKALRVMAPAGPGSPEEPADLPAGPNPAARLVAMPPFEMWRRRIDEPMPLPLGGPLRLWYVAEGLGELDFGEAEPADMLPGQCWVLPARCAPAEVRPGPGGLEIIECVALPPARAPRSPMEQ